MSDAASLVLPLLFAVYFALSADEEISDAVYRDRAIAAMFVQNAKAPL
jgi:hypothetical protein